MSKLYFGGYESDAKTNAINNALPRMVKDCMVLALSSKIGMRPFIEFVCRLEDIDDIIFKASNGRLDAPYYAVQVWSSYQKNIAQHNREENVRKHDIIGSILENFELSEGQYDWVYGQYMKLQMQIELGAFKEPGSDEVPPEDELSYEDTRLKYINAARKLSEEPEEPPQPEDPEEQEELPEEPEEPPEPPKDPEESEPEDPEDPEEAKKVQEYKKLCAQLKIQLEENKRAQEDLQRQFKQLSN